MPSWTKRQAISRALHERVSSNHAAPRHLAIDLLLGIVLLVLPMMLTIGGIPASRFTHWVGSIVASLTTRLRAQGTAVQDLLNEDKP
jgi:hypothetical protein